MFSWKAPAALVLAAVFAVACSESVVAPDGAIDGVAGTLDAAHVDHADIMNQAQTGIASADGAKIVRQPNGLRVSVRMPVPQPGTYVYPAGRLPGDNEVFTGWAFIFNYPDLCTDPCSGDDFGGPAGMGVYNFGGVFGGGGGQLSIAGRVGAGEPVFAGDTPLSNIAGAEVHIAIAPHGAVNAADLPDELGTPRGSPACGCWWVAIIE